MRRTLLLSMFSLTITAVLVSCTEPKPSKSLREQNLRDNQIDELRVSAAQQTLVEGERTRLSALVMVGDSVHSVSNNTAFYVDGSGEIVRDNGHVYYVAGAPTDDTPTTLYGILDSSEYGHADGDIESNHLEIFVLSKEKHSVTMPDVDSIETDSISTDDR